MASRLTDQVLQFKGDDRVFVPHDQIGKVSRYIGSSGAAPALDRLGGSHWQTVTNTARTMTVTDSSPTAAQRFYKAVPTP